MTGNAAVLTGATGPPGAESSASLEKLLFVNNTTTYLDLFPSDVIPWQVVGGSIYNDQPPGQILAFPGLNEGFLQYVLAKAFPSQTITLSVHVILGTATNLVLEIGGGDSFGDGMLSVLATVVATDNGPTSMTFVAPAFTDYTTLCLNVGTSQVYPTPPIQSAGSVETFGWQI